MGGTPFDLTEARHTFDSLLPHASLADGRVSVVPLESTLKARTWWVRGSSPNKEGIVTSSPCAIVRSLAVFKNAARELQNITYH
jgi:hypothetical protein